MADNRTVPVKKTGYRKRGKVKRTSQEIAQKRLDLFPKRERKPKDFRNLGDQVQFHNPVTMLGFGLVANVGDFATYVGEMEFAEAPSADWCAIRLKNGHVLYLPDDGKVFRWLD